MSRTNNQNRSAAATRQRLFAVADDAARQALGHPTADTEATAASTRRAYLDFLAAEPHYAPMRYKSVIQRGTA